MSAYVQNNCTAQYGARQRVKQPTTAAPAYWGSVRFFKHLILGVLALMILIPMAAAILFGLRCAAYRAQAQALEEQLDQAQADVQALTNAQESAADALLPPELPETQQPAYTALYPDLYAPETARSSVSPGQTVYLTFDDGPSARTPEILEILARYNVKATFFTVGKTDETSQQWMRDIAAAGHTLAVHSYTHEYKKIYASVEAFLEDFKAQYDLIYQATGAYPTVFRFPGGSLNGYNAATYQEIIAEMTRRGFVYFDWNVSSQDAVAKPPAATELVSNCLSKVSTLRRAVVLMHDSASKATTVQALPDIIQGYLDAGFSFAALTAETVPVTFGYSD